MRMIRWLISSMLVLAATGAGAQEPEEPRPVETRVHSYTRVPAQAAQDVRAAELLLRLRDIQDLTRINAIGANDPHREVVLKLKAAANESCAKCHAGGVSVKKDEGLGLTLVPADETLRSQLKLERAGLVVTAVAEGSPGEAAEVKEKDIVVAVAGKPVGDLEALKSALEASGAVPKPVALGSVVRRLAQPIALRVIRAGEPKELRVPPPSPPTLIVGRVTQLAEPNKAPSYWIGVSIDEADDTLRSHLKLPEGVGLVVTDVIKESPAEKAGVKKDDVLLSLEKVPLKTPDDMVKAVQATRGEKALALKVRRAGEALSIAVRPEKRKEPEPPPAATFRAVPLGEAQNRTWVAEVLPFIDGPGDKTVAFSTIHAPDGQFFVTGQPIQGQAINLFTRAADRPADEAARADMKAALIKDVEVELRKAFEEWSKKSAAPQETLSRIDAQLRALETQIGEIKQSVDDLRGSIKKEK